MPFGYIGKILHVDLTKKKIDVEEKDDNFYRKYLGGRGIGHYYLLKEVPPGIDSLSPDNVLVLATGVMTGIPIPASCRFTASGMSPLTGTAGESEAGGFFGPELKKAGFDAVVIHGRSENPVYLWITHGNAEIKDAAHLAGLGTKEFEDAIRKALGSKKIRVAQTGLAGMNRVRFANITNNLGHFNGRCGLGALMGAKNVRGVAVLGTDKIPLFDSDFLLQTAREYAKTFRNNPLGEVLYTYGTTAAAGLLSEEGSLPVNNFRESTLDNANPVSGDTYNALLLKSRKGCYACPIRCKRVIAFEDSKYAVDSRYGGPEYETIAALGTNLNIVNLKAIAKANEICSRYCMDTISAGMTIAFACECFEEGVISKGDTNGLTLKFGDADLVLDLLEMIAHRHGFGDLPAEGSARLAQLWGITEKPYNLTVKGQEIPLHFPCVKVGVGFGYAFSPYGADHMTAPHDPLIAEGHEFGVESVKCLGIYDAVHPTDITNEKVRTYRITENLWRMMDALGLCVFGFAPRGPMTLDTIVRCLNAATGWNTSLYELLKSGERGNVLAKAFNSREGFTIKDDRLPKRLFYPKPSGLNAGKKTFHQHDFDRAIELLYKLSGFDPTTGKPTHEKLVDLNLEWVEALL